MTNETQARIEPLLIAINGTDKTAANRAFVKLWELCRCYIIPLCQSFHLQDYDEDDKEQIARIALFQACRGYEPAKASFLTYYYTTVNCELLHRRDRQNTRKRGAGIMYEEPSGDLPDRDENDWIQTLDHWRELLPRLAQQCTEKQQTVLVSYMRGSSEADIARQLGVSRQAVHSQLTLIKQKAQKLLDSRD
jgi:RNA polymerase sigma factor (sigma-70 family)